MEPEKGTSSPARSSPSLLALLGILVSFILIAIMSRKKRHVTPHASSKPANQGEQSNPQVATTSTPQTQFQPSHRHCEITCKQEKDWWDKAERIVAILGLVLLGIYTGYTIKMYCANKKAAYAAESAATTAHDALVISTRPWVQVKGELNFAGLGFVAAQGGHVRLESSMTYTLENTGSSPAFRVSEDIAPIFPTDASLPNGWRLQACKISDKLSSDINGVVIMPKATTDKPHPIRVDAPIPDNIKQVTFMWVVGCISYQDTFSKTLHHTKLLYIMRSSKPIILTRLPTPFPTDAIQLVDSDAD